MNLVQENEAAFKNSCRVGAHLRCMLITHTICKTSLIKTTNVHAFTGNSRDRTLYGVCSAPECRHVPEIQK